MLFNRLVVTAGTCLAFCSGTAAMAGWVESPGPYGHEVGRVIQATDGTLLVPSYGGLAARRPGATRWGWAGLDATAAGDIAVAAGRSVWLWHDGAWSDLMANEHSPPWTDSVALAPDGTVCLGGDSSAIRCTSDRGASWRELVLDLNDRAAVVATGAGVMVAVVRPHSDPSHRRFLRSEDGGASWSEVWSAASIVYALSRDAGGRVVGSLLGGRVFGSDISATTWTLAGRPLAEVTAVARDASGRWYAAGGREALVTSTDGIEWQPFDDGLAARYPAGWQVETLAAGAELVYAGTRQHGLVVRRLPSNPLPPQAPSPTHAVD